jgi:hypothetical protein
MEHNQCGPNCNYRKLYESSQISLSDMSGKQAGALARVGRIRAAVVSVIRKNFPSQSIEFEKTYGMRMIDMDDELILAFLENVVNMNNSREAKTTLEAVGRVLLNKGIIIDFNKPVSWIDDISRYQKIEKELSTQTHFDTIFKNQRVEQKEQNVQVDKNILEPKIKNENKVEIITENNEKNDSFIMDFISNEFAEIDGVTEIDTISVSSENSVKDLDEVLGWVDNANNLSSLFNPGIVSIIDNADISTNNNTWSPSPIKPENLNDYKLSKAKPTKTKKKEIRVQASQPLSVRGIEGTTKLDDRLRSIFMSAVTIPRPVFTRDLVSFCDDIEVIEEWEQESRSNVDLGLRFISPKQRHRNRGSLIIPSKSLRISSKKKSEDWWNTAIDMYMGAKLYELAVLLHRTGDEIISYDFNDYNAVIKLNTQKGIVVLLTVMNDRLEVGTDSRESLTSQIKNSSKEKISYIAVLSTLGEEKEMERLIANMNSINQEENLGLSCPLVASRTWEFANDRGSTAKIISE